jgi:Flp pilus assembly protein protease CpaA
MFTPEVLTTPNLSCVIVLVMTALFVELRTGCIPNWLTLIGLLAGISLAFMDQLWSAHGVGLVLGMIIGIALYALANAGAGLAKLLIVVGSIIGPIVPVSTLVVTVLAVAYYRVLGKPSVPSDLKYQGEQEVTSIKGSILVSVGTVVGVVLLNQPWA